MLRFLLIFIALSIFTAQGRNIYSHSGIIQADSTKAQLSLVFTADSMADGAESIMATLKKEQIQGAFFFTGAFIELYPLIISDLIAQGHYVGSHSYAHLLYAPWDNREKTLISKQEFTEDIRQSYSLLHHWGITTENTPYFIPPYEWYNDSIARWANDLGLQIINFTPGTGSNADYTTPEMSNYRSSQQIIDRIFEYEVQNGLNGHLLLIHLGVDPKRTDKFYLRLPELIAEIRHRGYKIIPLKELLSKNK